MMKFSQIKTCPKGVHHIIFAVEFGSSFYFKSINKDRLFSSAHYQCNLFFQIISASRNTCSQPHLGKQCSEEQNRSHRDNRGKWSSEYSAEILGYQFFSLTQFPRRCNWYKTLAVIKSDRKYHFNKQCTGALNSSRISHLWACLVHEIFWVLVLQYFRCYLIINI